ncbi:lipoate--protein ligase family protein, partial [Candidatus Bipolaricaulota bacterium]|nr:lipoate--protein ligase family protein [Candidatus Bipolaricaulota bacterium]
PAWGLAIEEVLFESARHGGCESIRFWINERAVILGRSQSITVEVDEAHAQTLGIPILRRISGGGTVYHYPGNLNLSVFLRKRSGLTEVSSVFRFFGHALTEALAQLGPKLLSEDNGLYVDGLKVGGAAQARRGDAVLYHTTLLVQPCPIPMEKLLLAMRSGYRSEGIASRPRATTSLAEHVARSIEFKELVAPITDALVSALDVCLEPGMLTVEEEERAIALVREKYGSSKWNRRL